MNEYDVKRLALVLALQAEIEGMKITNRTMPSEDVRKWGYSELKFMEKAQELRDLAYKHNEQL
jgi:hypothetical protein